MGKKRRRASAVCVYKGQMLLVLLEDDKAQRQFWVPPGGQIEAGENALQAAQRETLEETGYQLKMIPQRQVTHTYPFVWKGQKYLTTTTFVLAELEDPNQALVNNPQRESYIRESRWWPLQEGLELMQIYPDIAGPCERLLRQAGYVT